MPNLLDLKPKQKPTIIERVVFKKRAWWVEVIKMFVVIIVVASAVYGVSKAEDSSVQPSLPAQSLTGVYGVVVSMSGDSLVLDDSQGSKYPGVDVFNVDLRHVKTVETNDDIPTPLALTDIVAGDKVIARGIIIGSNLDAQDVISFSYVKPVATTTEATSTEATSTEATTTEATSTSANATTTPDTTATSTATSTDEVATTTEATTPDTTAASTDSSATTTDTATDQAAN